MNLLGPRVGVSYALLLRQAVRFGLVGAAATAVHTGVLIVLVEMNVTQPTPANVLAFCCAIFISYFGHYYWTFSSTARHQTAFLRFSVAAVVGFLLNYGIFAVIVDTWRMNYLIALAIVLILVPATTFALNKLWAFR